MKAHTMEWVPTAEPRFAKNRAFAQRVTEALRLATKALLALVPAAAILVGAAWMVSLPELVLYLQAMTWAAGFVFVGLAIESESAEASILSLATGIVLPVLAALSARLAPELLLVAAALIAAWIATAILRR
jgi:hypothetical protein